jgi:hypothetical protein
MRRASSSLNAASPTWRMVNRGVAFRPKVALVWLVQPSRMGARSP